jgi:tetratricopeptide (TPR) repeat protein/O-antigen ligase
VQLIELCWLAALVSTPLYFNIFSSRIFEPDKIALLRSLALVAAGLVIFDRVILRVPGNRVELRNPVTWAVAALVGVYILSTALSVAPYVSLLGSYQRLQGVYSLLSYLVIGATILLYLREPGQVRRLAFFLITTSVPVSLYGILQHFGLDPVGWKGDVRFRVSSTLGNPIFLAAYLIFVVPVALSRLYGLLSEVRSRENDKKEALSVGRLAVVAGLLTLQNVVLYLVLLGELSYLRTPLAGQGGLPPLGPWWLMPAAVAFFLGCGWLANQLTGSGRQWTRASALGTALALALMLSATFLSQSRGPWLGLGAGLFVWAGVMLLLRGRKRLALAALWLAVVFGMLLAILNLPNSPLAPLRSLPYVGRLGQLAETQTGTGKVRLLIWQGALELSFREPLRTFIGYGPDTMFYVFGRVYPPELAHYEARNATPDRAHNALLDAQVNTGVAGLLSLLGLFAAAGFTFVRGLRSLADGAEKLLLVGLGSALASHFVEIQTGIQVAATWLYFFAYTAMMARLVYGGFEGVAAVVKPAGQGRRSPSVAAQRRQVKGRLLAGWIWIVALAMALGVGWLIWYTNVRPIIADMYLQLGQGIAAGGRRDIALMAYVRASEMAPDQGYYRFAVAGGAIDMAQRARSDAERDRYFAMAKDALLEAVRVEPLNTDHPANLSRLLRLWGESRKDPAMLQEAVGWAQEALQLSPNSAQLWDELAIAKSLVAQTAGSIDVDRWRIGMAEAQQAFQRAMELDPIYAASFVYLGDYYYRPQGDAASACASYARAVSLDPGSLAIDSRADERLAYCKANGGLGHVADGLVAYVQRHPDSFAANSTLGYVLYHMGQLSDSISYFQRATKLAPGDFNVHKNLAIVYSDTGRFEEALRELDRAISLAPQDQTEQLRSLLQYLRTKVVR